MTDYNANFNSLPDQTMMTAEEAKAMSQLAYSKFDKAYFYDKDSKGDLTIPKTLPEVAAALYVEPEVGSPGEFITAVPHLGDIQNPEFLLKLDFFDCRFKSSVIMEGNKPCFKSLTEFKWMMSGIFNRMLNHIKLAFNTIFSS